MYVVRESEDQRGSRVLEDKRECRVGDDTSVKRNVCSTSFEYGDDANDHRNRTLYEKTDA